MATDIFSSVRGVVTAVSSIGVPVGLAIQYWGGYQFFKSVVTNMTFQSQGNVQFLHTLRDFIYIYTFGERIGELTIHGVSFAFPCEHPSQPTHGLEYVLAYYSINRTAARATPIPIVLGSSTTFWAFLTGIKLDFHDAEKNMGQFVMTFHSIPGLAPLDMFF